MDHIAVICDPDAQEELAGLEEALHSAGLSPRISQPSDATGEGIVSTARCTIIVWSPSSALDPRCAELARTAVFRNVMIPLRASKCNPSAIPRPYHRVRPAVLPALSSNELTALSESRRIVEAIRPLWPPSDPVKALPDIEQPRARPPILTPLLTLALWLSACFLISGLIVWALSTFNPYAASAMRSDAVYATARRKMGPLVEWLQPEGTHIRLSTSHPSLAGVRRIAIHGYNVPASQFTTYFRPLFSSIGATQSPTANAALDWASGVRPSSVLGPLSFFWTIVDGFFLDAVGTEIELYDLGRRNAEHKGSDALIELIQNVYASNGNQPIDIVAHSMGCHLALQALKKRPDLASRVGKLILLAPAVQSTVFEDKQLIATLAQTRQVHIYFSRNDNVLRLFGSFRHASPMLGAVGPPAKVQLPPNFQLHDVTDVLGNRDVHGIYLRPEGIDKLRLADTISR